MTDPLDDMGRTRRFMEVQQRHGRAMVRILPHQVSEAVVEELREIVAEYDRLLEMGPPDYPFYSADDVRRRRADALEHAGRACDSLRDGARARELLAAAVHAYQEVGDVERAAQAGQALAGVEYDDTGDVNEEIGRLQERLGRAPEDSLEHAMAQLAVGEAYLRGGDDFSAEPYLELARQELEALGQPDPAGADRAAAVLETLRAIQDGTARVGSTPVETLAATQGAYLRIYQCLSQIHKERGDLERAAELSDRLRRLQESSLGPEDLAPIFGAMQALTFPAQPPEEEPPAVPGAGRGSHR